jgi:hypothetical protein
MKLGAKQELFATLLGRLLREIDKRGYSTRVGEVFRPPEMAAIYAERGQGIKNSNHTRKIAVDLFLVVDGVLKWDGPVYKELGEWWEAQHELCRWGGRFRNRDVYHFSLEHGGIK